MRGSIDISSSHWNFFTSHSNVESTDALENQKQEQKVKRWKSAGKLFKPKRKSKDKAPLSPTSPVAPTNELQDSHQDEKVSPQDVYYGALRRPSTGGGAKYFPSRIQSPILTPPPMSPLKEDLAQSLPTSFFMEKMKNQFASDIVDPIPFLGRSRTDSSSSSSLYSVIRVEECQEPMVEPLQEVSPVESDDDDFDSIFEAYYDEKVGCACCQKETDGTFVSANFLRKSDMYTKHAEHIRLTPPPSPEDAPERPTRNPTRPMRLSIVPDMQSSKRLGGVF